MLAMLPLFALPDFADDLPDLNDLPELGPKFTCGCSCSGGAVWLLRPLMLSQRHDCGTQWLGALGNFGSMNQCLLLPRVSCHSSYGSSA